MITPADLRISPVMADLSDQELAVVAELAEEMTVEAGGVLTREGDPADAMYVILSGEIQYRRESIPDSPLFVSEAGELAGLLPFSRMQRYGATVRALQPLRLARIGRERFPEMLRRVPELEARLVAAMTDRVREVTRAEQQRDKLLALGRLSAGLAHELNNPASAVRRGASQLREQLGLLPGVTASLAGCNLNPAQFAALAALQERKLAAESPPHLSPLQASEREEETGAWLEARGVAAAWRLAEVFVSAGVTLDELGEVEQMLSARSLGDALAWLGSGLSADRLLREVEEASARISRLVSAVKEYSYMDQSQSYAETDVHRGLESTLTMLGHRLRDRGVRVERDYAAELPRPWASPGDLNQVWTNLIDNAIAAAPRGGRILLRTLPGDGDEICVQVRDDGPGIPEELLDRIWEPFFTTKDVGEGTGLGLDIVRRIVVRQHGGQVMVRSRPGDTCFEVRIPIHPQMPISAGPPAPADAAVPVPAGALAPSA